MGLTHQYWNHIMDTKENPVDAFQCIYVSSKETENKVADMLKQKGVIFPPPFITVMRQWFE